MRVLLDTHAVLWAVADPDRLGRHRGLVATWAYDVEVLLIERRR